MANQRGITKVLFLVSLTFLCLCFSLFTGDVKFTLHDIILLLNGQGSDLQKVIFFHLRLPHTINAFTIGCLLSLSGYLMQVTLANPLADPYTLGTSGGAAVFTLAGMMLGWNGFWIISCSFFGCLISLLVLTVAVGSIKTASSSRLLLTGVVLAGGWGALLSLLLILAPALETKSILFWLFGDIDSHSYPIFAMSCLIVGIVFCVSLYKELMALSQGNLLAKTVGVDTEKAQYKLIILSAFLTASAVSLGGLVGFVGLIVPHLTRMLIKSHDFFLLPVTIFIGGCLLVISDVLARIMIAPEQIPVGIITTLIGIPFFLFLLRGRGG